MGLQGDQLKNIITKKDEATHHKELHQKQKADEDREDGLLSYKPIIGSDEDWLDIPKGASQAVKTKALIKNIGSAVDNKVENLITSFLNEYY